MQRLIFSMGMLLLANHSVLGQTAADGPQVDILLTDGTVVDGSGSPGIVADVAIDGAVIRDIGDLKNTAAKWTIDCSGLVICPGFIDLHNHSDRPVTRPETRAAANYVTQGCTTMVTGNCGSGPVDTAAYYRKIDEHGAGTNIAHLIPQGSVRERVLGTANIQPDEDQLNEILALTERAMQDGAWGMSTGLIYVPSSYATTTEITEMAKVVSRHGGFYASHIRGEGTGLLRSVEEALTIGRDAGIPVHVSHFKASGRDAWGLVREAARMIAEERDKGRTVTADQYPYIASSTSLGATLLPSSARAGGRKALVERFSDARTGPELRDLLQTAIAKRDNGRAVRIASYISRTDWVGLSLSEIAERENRDAAVVAEEILCNGGASVVNFSMSEDDVRYLMTIDWVATASDGGAKLPSSTRPHPRNYGTFPRKIGYYAVTEGVLPLAAAIHSMTGLPASILKLKDRGLIKKGLAADIVVFDPKTIRDTATFDHPHQYATGIRYVFVNGVTALSEGHLTGALAGKALRSASYSVSGKKGTD
ncbi:MAG: D-aminoacylase [Fuerstiella sp.]